MRMNNKYELAIEDRSRMKTITSLKKLLLFCESQKNLELHRPEYLTKKHVFLNLPRARKDLEYFRYFILIEPKYTRDAKITIL